MKYFKAALLGSVIGSLIGCGKAPTSPAPTFVTTNGSKQAVISIYNSGTQDSSMGTQYVMPQAVNATVPSVVLRTQGTTLQSGLGVGVDFGGSIGQCYYNADTASQNVFTLTSCTNSMVAGTAIQLKSGQIITLWSYNHVNSNDSIVEIVIQGVTQ